MVAVAAAAGLIGPGCSLVDDEADPARVLVVGDSVTRLSQEEIRQEMDWAETLDIRAHDGFRTDELLTTTLAGIEAEPDIAVVMTGYNDVNQETVDTDALGQMVELVGRASCAVWLLLPDGDGGAQDLAARWNERVEQAVADHDSIHLSSEWHDLVSDSPPYTYVSEADAVHPNDRGQRAIAEVMSEAADRECR